MEFVGDSLSGRSSNPGSRALHSLAGFCTILVLGICGCGGSGSQPPPPPPPPQPMISSVSVAPANAIILVKATQQFAANVQGSGNFNPTVNWYVNDVQGGNSTVGTITASGLFTAPNTVPNPAQVTVKAQSVQDTSKSGTSSATINPENVQISVSPTSASLQLSGTQKFNVTVTGTLNQSFSWTINGQPITAATPWGTIDSTGFYSAPSLLPANPVVTLTATSLEDPTKSASAVATITATAGGITVTIAPQNPQVVFDGSQSIQFTATVTGTNNTAVNWSVDNNGGTSAGNITSAGVFTPLTFGCSNVVPSAGIHAVSVANSGAQAVTTVNLVPPTPTITGISPQPAAAETNLQISGTFAQGATLTLQFPGPNGTTIPSATNLDTGIATGGLVPLGATSGPLSVQQACVSPSSGFQYPTTLSKPVNFQRLPHLRIRADKKDLATGEPVQLHAVLMGDTTPQPIVWGSGISATGVYTAPFQVSPDTFVTLSACIQSTSVCDSLIVRVNPVVIDPEAPTLPLGATLQLSATSGSTTVSPSWSILAGGGSLLASGAYTAPTTRPDSGGVLVAASYGGFTSKASIGVTGALPGLVNRINDYLDNSTTTPPTGTLTSSLAVDSSHAYVLSADTLPIWAVPKYCWIDVYDISDPVHPVWIDAAEALNSEPSTFKCSGTLYTYGGFLFELLGGEIAAFAVQNNHLTLQHLWQIPSVAIPPAASYSFNQGIFYALPEGSNASFGGPIPAYIFDVRTGDLVQTSLNLPSPQPGLPAEVFTPTGAGNFMYCLINESPPPANSSFKIAVYDVSMNPPSLVGTVDAMVGIPGPPLTFGGILKTFGNKLYDGWDVYDISGSLPIRLGTVPFNIQDVNISRSLAVSGIFAAEVLDVASPGTANVTGILDDGVFDFQGSPVWVGDLVYQTERRAGWAVYGAVPMGGQLPRGRLDTKGTVGTTFNQVVSGNFLYTAQQGDFSGVLIYDVSSSPPVLVGSYSETGQNPLSLALVGNFLFVGTNGGLLALDVSTPAAPAKVATLAIPTSAMAVSGNFLFAGTTDHRLLVFNVSNPTAPSQIAQVSLPDFPVTLRTAGSLLFIADNTAGLLTFGISIPSNPMLLSQFQPSSAVEDAAIDGNLALLAAADGGLVIADLTNPAKPLLVSQVRLDALTCFSDCYGPAGISVAIHDGLAYLGTANTVYERVLGFDYRTPTHPRLVSTAAYGDAVDQGLLSFAFSQAEMFVAGRQIDVSQPRNVINLYYPGFPGGSGSLNLAAVQKAAISAHPKIRASIRQAN
jgi:hypothetical protein